MLTACLPACPPAYLLMGSCRTSPSPLPPSLALCDSSLPPLWRLLQCLRAYHTDRKPRHLANAVKYSSSFPVIFISAQISSFQVDSPFFSYWPSPRPPFFALTTAL